MCIIGNTADEHVFRADETVCRFGQGRNRDRLGMAGPIHDYGNCRAENLLGNRQNIAADPGQGELRPVVSFQ